MNRQGQAATEFLLTYGWALVITITVITTIIALDPLQYTQQTQSTCTTNPETVCDAQKIRASPSELFFTLQNKAGEQQTYTNITIKQDQNNTPCFFTQKDLSPNEEQRIYCQNLSLTQNELATIPYKYTTYPTSLGQQYKETHTGRIKTTPRNDNTIANLLTDQETTKIGETTTITSTSGQWQTIQFKNEYQDPVLVGMRNTQNGADGVIIEFKDITTTSAKTRVCSIKHNPPGNGCRTTNEQPETIGILIIDASKQIPGIQAGKTTMSKGIGAGGTQTVQFPQSFSQTPHVYTSTAIQNGPSPVAARVTSTSTTSFTGGLCKMNNGNTDNCDSNHPEEELHWIAINHAELNTTLKNEPQNVYTGGAGWESISLTQTYQNPVVLTEVQGYRGTQDVTVGEARNIQESNVQIRFCEFDYNGQCDSHRGNTVVATILEEGTLQSQAKPQKTIYNPAQSIQTYTQPGTQTIQFPPTITHVDILLVAGGGGGGGRHGGGGGAGGLIYKENYKLPSQTVDITIGNGGAGGPSSSGKGQNGGNTVFHNLTAIGGGGGGAHNAGDSGQNGGSGGGESNKGVGQGTPGQGHNGGTSTAGSPWNHGGGGGAGEPGKDATTNKVGDGGDGKYYGDIFTQSYGENGWFAAGGGGGSHDPNPNTWGEGGKGGGGDGANPQKDGSLQGKHAEPNTGSGGGGGSRSQSIKGTAAGGPGGDGATGIILIKPS